LLTLTLRKMNHDDACPFSGQISGDGSDHLHPGQFGRHRDVGKECRGVRAAVIARELGCCSGKRVIAVKIKYQRPGA
jgi:hypothetical protein